MRVSLSYLPPCLDLLCLSCGFPAANRLICSHRLDAEIRVLLQNLPIFLHDAIIAKEKMPSILPPVIECITVSPDHSPTLKTKALISRQASAQRYAHDRSRPNRDPPAFLYASLQPKRRCKDRLESRKHLGGYEAAEGTRESRRNVRKTPQLTQTNRRKCGESDK